MRLYTKTYTRLAEIERKCRQAVSLQLYGHHSQYLARRTFLGQEVRCGTALFLPRVLKVVYQNGLMIAWGAIVEERGRNVRDIWRYVKPAYRNQGIGAKLKGMLE